MKAFGVPVEGWSTNPRTEGSPVWEYTMLICLFLLRKLIEERKTKEGRNYYPITCKDKYLTS